jgi:mono/diheme cytochrome c family protein
MLAPACRPRGGKTDDEPPSTILPAGLLAASAAAAAPDAGHGAVIVECWCAACHIVAPDQAHGADNVPSFESVAKRTRFNADKLTRFLQDPHPKMPNLALTRAERRTSRPISRRWGSEEASDLRGGRR